MTARERARCQRWSALGVAVCGGLIFVAGCERDPGARLPSGDPIVQMEPPNPSDDGATAPGCEGITESGTCRGAAAIYCNLETGTLRRSDCEVMQNQTCVVDSRRGAMCASPPDGVPPDGLCEGDVGYWTKDDLITRWDCGAEGSRCLVDACAEGAYCCDDPADDCCSGADPECTNPCPDEPPPPGDPSTPPPVELDCDKVGYAGVCVNAAMVARCVGDAVSDYGCYNGYTCQVDTCRAGFAECCPPGQDGDTSNTPEGCDGLDSGGECVGDQLRYCSGGSVINVDGYAGLCDGNTLYYCIDDEVREEACGADSCEVDTCFPGGAECC